MSLNIYLDSWTQQKNMVEARDDVIVSKDMEERRLTLRLLLIRSDGAYEVLRRHVDLGISMLTDDLQCGKVAENLIWGGVSSYPVLILHHLPSRQEEQFNIKTFSRSSY